MKTDPKTVNGLDRKVLGEELPFQYFGTGAIEPDPSEVENDPFEE